MTLHKLSAGSGYTYLTSQVAQHDATERRQAGLASYYEEKGEAPGRWMGTGLAGLDLEVGDVVSEEQMKLLFGQGRHPRSGEPAAAAKGWGALGRVFPTFNATTLRQVIARAFSEHNTSQGLAWNAPIPAGERAVIRTRVAREVFEQRHGRTPVDEAELTRFFAKASKPAQVPVAGFDLTFSPVKSVSALWALAPADVARQVEAAHADAVRATLAMLEAEVAFTRMGKGGIRQVPVVGLIAAAFDHRDSRTGDPDLHTHVVVSNKVQSLPQDGSRWLTLDGRMLFKAKVMASEHYNTHLEAGLVDRLGVRFLDRPGVEGKRAVREIDGIAPALLAAWSSRRQAIQARQRELASTFLTEHGRTPTTVESLDLAQRANLETRPGKHEPRSEVEQRQAWHQQATTMLAGTGLSPKAMVAAALGTQWVRNRERAGDAGREAAVVAGQRVGAQQGRVRVQRGGGVRPQVVAARVLAVLEGSRATWQVWHVRAETSRQLRTAGVPLARLEEYGRAVERWVLQGFSVPVGVPPQLGEPEVLRRPDGQPAHTVHGSQAYTSRAILAAEEELLSLALRRDGRHADLDVVESVLAAQRAGGPGLDRSQVAMVHGLATSGCRVQVALAPAGAGKTAALRVLARAWEATGGTVLGLAPTAVAADELARATGISADTLAKHLHETTAAGASAAPAAPSAVGEAGRVGPGTLVVIDEAGMAGTRALADVVRQVVDAGGSVRLVGDDQQLAAVAAGGILTDLAEQGYAHGTTVTLTELHRFTDPAEGEATLAIRDGDPAALEHYLDRGRVHAGDAGTMAETAYAAWKADQQAGTSSLLLAATRDTWRELNQRARQDRLHATAGQASGPEVTLADGTRASSGDLVVTRRNDRRLRAGDGAWVKNGDRWRVLAVHPDGAVTVDRQDGRARHEPGRVRLPAGYVAEHVQLGYASTIHGAQGATVDTTHTILTGTETRQGLYVALSRGRQTNHLYLAEPAVSLDSVGPEVQDTVAEPRQVLTDILARDGRAQSATTVEHGDTAGLLREAVLAYQDALTVLAQHHLGPEQMAALDDALERWLPGLTRAPAYPHLRGQLAVRWADGTRPESVVQEATLYRGKRTLTEAEDPAAALTWRISALTPLPHRDAPLPWLPDIPPALREEPGTSTYLDRLTGRIDDLKHQVTDQAQRAGASDRVPWQRMLPPDVDEQLLGDLAVWRAAHAVPHTEPRPTGAPVKDPDVARHQTRLTRRLNPLSPPRGRPMEGTAGERLRASQRQAEQHARYGHPSSEVSGPSR